MNIVYLGRSILEIGHSAPAVSTELLHNYMGVNANMEVTEEERRREIRSGWPLIMGGRSMQGIPCPFVAKSNVTKKNRIIKQAKKRMESPATACSGLV